MGGVSPAQPVRADPVVKAQGVQPDLKGTHVQGPLGAARVLVGSGLSKERRRAVPAGFGQYLLGQLEHEVGRRFGGLIGQGGVGPFALESCHLDIGQSRSNHVAHFVDRGWAENVKTNGECLKSGRSSVRISDAPHTTLLLD